MRHSTAVALAVIVVLPVIWPDHAAAQLPPVKPYVGAERPNPHPYRNFRYQIPLPTPAPIVPQPAPPPLHIHNRPYEAPPGPSQAPSGGGPAPSLPGGMEITVVKQLSSRPLTDNRQEAQAISLPRQAAEQLATCWSPPLPPKGEANEVTLRFAFNRAGSVIGGAPRITFVKPGQGVSRDELRQSVLSAFKACTPLHFSDSMAASMPGYPLSIRFIGRREQD
jgi:hypothetical protein